jgi:nitrogen fixation protein FixH
VLNIRARDPKDALLAGLAVSARLERPTDRREDRLLDVTESGGGSYRGKAEDVAAGQWDLVIEADRGDQRLFLSRNRVVLN